MVMPRWSFRRNFADRAVYPVNLNNWLASIDDTLLSYTVGAPAGITVDDSETGGVVSLESSGGAVGDSNRITVDAVSVGGRTVAVDIVERVWGREQIVAVPVPTITLITGTAPAVGAGVARAGSDWTYEYLLVADAAGATATVRVRVGTTIACATPFPNVVVTVSGTPDPDGKYRGSYSEDTNQFWPFHAADIISISGTNALATVNADAP